MTEGFAAAAPTLARARRLLLALDVNSDEARRSLWRAGGTAGGIVAAELWDAESWHAILSRQARFARETGALVHYQLALSFLARSHVLAGELTTAALIVEEDRLLAEVTGNAPFRSAEMMLAAWCGQEVHATASGLGTTATFAAYASSL